jgi:AcrR family transcriptional regulator
MSPQQRAEETRARILDAAEESFSRSGYDPTSVDDICIRAGVTKGAFYHHFPSKQAVFIELLNRWLAGLDAELSRVRAGASSVPEALMQMAATAQTAIQAQRERLPMFLEFWTKAAHDPAIWEATIAPYRRYQDFFAEMIEAGIAEGTLRPIDPHAAAQALLSLAVGLVVQGMLDSQGDWGQVMQESIEIFLKGLGRE